MNEQKVLLIDSNIMDVLRAERSLSAAGFVVARLTTPNGALAKIEFERPDALLLDITMSRLNVQELLDGVKSDPALEDLVVVLFSDLDATTLQAMCVDHDMHGYYSKSMDIDRVGEFLQQFYAEGEEP